MATLAELPFAVRTYLRFYRWRRVDPVPCAPMAKPLARCRVALVSTAGLVPRGEPPFDVDAQGGDWSYRVVAAGSDLGTLQDFQRSGSFDHTGIARDRNLALPLDRLGDLAADGTIGAVAPRHLSFMGSITAPGRLMRDAIPAAAQLLVDDAVDVALLVPV